MHFCGTRMTVGLGGQTRRNQWLLYSQRGLRSAHWEACVTSGWLVSSAGLTGSQ